MIMDYNILIELVLYYKMLINHLLEYQQLSYISSLSG